MRARAPLALILVPLLALSACVDPMATGPETPDAVAAQTPALYDPVPLPLDGNGDPVIELGGAAPVARSAFGVTPPVIGGDVPTLLVLTGADWSGKIDLNALTLTAPALPEGATAEVRRTGYVGGSDYTGKIAGKDLRINVSRQDCTDPATGRRAGYGVRLTLGGTDLTGCAVAGKKPRA